jgi:hypothetical protein
VNFSQSSQWFKASPREGLFALTIYCPEQGTKTMIRVTPSSRVKDLIKDLGKQFQVEKTDVNYGLFKYSSAYSASNVGYWADEEKTLQENNFEDKVIYHFHLSSKDSCSNSMYVFFFFYFFSSGYFGV